MPPGAGMAPGPDDVAVVVDKPAGAAADRDGPGNLRPLPTLVYGAEAAGRGGSPGGGGGGHDRYPRSAYDDVSFWQLLTFSFVTPVVKQGLRKPLQQEDLEDVRGHGFVLGFGAV